MTGVEGKFVLVRAMEAYRGSRSTAPFIPNLGNRRMWVVNATPRPLCRPERNPVPIEYEAGWAPKPVWAFRRAEEYLLLLGFEPQTNYAVQHLQNNW